MVTNLIYGKYETRDGGIVLREGTIGAIKSVSDGCIFYIGFYDKKRKIQQVSIPGGRLDLLSPSQLEKFADDFGFWIEDIEQIAKLQKSQGTGEYS